ncbi:MAG TPA: EAL domain-containing protein [Solirubrobacteraceae bacterium]|jgi:hyaluronan synthase/N-acetylglucosaminyltransferase|nr:EAL domain-containing protein [Solirubrobacteraceae bacterium]
MPQFIEIYLIVYGVLALGHIFLQMILGYMEHRRQAKRTYAETTPRVTVVVPAYNEDPALLHRCLLSIDRQDYPEIEAIVVDDGSANVEAVLPVHDEFSSGRFRVILQPDNSGKRNCQAVVFEKAMGDIVITIDSDTVLSPDAIRKIVRRFEDPKVGAVTGDVQVINERQNLLTRLIAYRYWTAFNQERAAQSYFGVVMCASGPFSAYRRSIIDQVREAYIHQRFLGSYCSFGDDRHLTNLVLGLGYDVVYDEAAVAKTLVPHKVRGYLRQQLRWSKSFYREILWTARFVRKRHWYMGLDLGLQTFMPFALIAAIGLTIYAAIINPSTLLRYAAIVVGIGFIRALTGLARTRKPGFLLFTLYGFIHVFLLIPVRICALATMGKGGWGTRMAPEANEAARRGIVHSRSQAGRAEAETAWSRDIRRSVAGGQNFELYWQPVRSLWTGELTHAEVLLRLRHDGHVLPPADFLQIAARNGLMMDVDEWVLSETISLLAAQPAGSRPRLEINLSDDSIRDAAFTNRVGAQLAQHDVSPRKLVLCIPERFAVSEPAAAAAFARRARSLGCLVALDNFGQTCEGFDTTATEHLLAELALDYVKLDGSLIRPLPYSSGARDALHGLLAKTQERGIETVAVFVGDDETVQVLAHERVDYAQGFYIGTPDSTVSTLEEIADRAAEQYAATVVGA